VNAQKGGDADWARASAAMDGAKPAPAFKDVEVFGGARKRGRALALDGSRYELRYDKKAWFYGMKDGKTHWGPETGPVKLHVVTDSPKDLAKLQKALIPGLFADPDVVAFKTMDPLRWATQDAKSQRTRAKGPKPNGRHQEAKGFTVYLPADAAAVRRARERLSKDIEAKGLSLKSRMRTGNVDKMDGTGRVGLVRSEFPYALSEDGRYEGVLIEPAVAERLEKEFREELKLGERTKFTYEELREIERRTGLKSRILRYSELRSLMIATGQKDELAEKLLAAIFEKKVEQKLTAFDDEYLSESGAGREFGELSARPALYALAARYGIDLTELALAELEKAVPPKR
jgi:hypothetical protein